MKHQIKHRYTGAVLFECDVTEDVQASGMATRYALEKAVKDGAYLRGAYLDGANLDAEEKLIGDRPVFMVGPIGTRCDYLTAYLTDNGIRLRAGCFFGDVDTFRAKLEETHGDSDYAAEYQAALALIEKHAESLTPKEEVQP